MFHLETFVVRGHRKMIDHYRWLRDTARSEEERERFQRRMMKECEALKRYTEQQPRSAQRAA
jgi:protease II